jgi:hypothetical protein
MQKFAAVALVALVSGYMYAQQADRTETTTTTTTWNGTLVDNSCRTTHSEHKSTESTQPDRNTSQTKTTTTNTATTECPVTMTTTNFGLLTTDGKYVRFDEPSNTRIVEVVKSKKWDKLMSEKKPVKVRVVGNANGDVVVIKTID